MARKLPDGILKEVRIAITTYDKKSFLDEKVNLDKWHPLSKMANEIELENFISEKNIYDEDEKIEYKDYKNKEFYQMEKVDGSNWSITFFVVEGKINNLWICKRTAEIKNEFELTPGSIKIASKYVDEFQTLAELVYDFNLKSSQSEHSTTMYFTAFGELYGGKINSRVDYAMPKPDIVLYSICINGKKVTASNSIDFLTKSKLPMVPVMRKGKLIDLYQKLKGEDNLVDKTISPLALRNNKGVAKPKMYFEGVVFHPVDYGTLIKCRSAPFLEKEPKSKKPVKPEKKKDEFSSITKKQREICVKYFKQKMIENRVLNYISKIGQITFQEEDIKQSIDSVIKDLIDDAESELMLNKFITESSPIINSWIRAAVFKTVSTECNKHKTE